MPDLAIAQLFDSTGKLPIGTAFAVSKYLAITARHCIEDEDTGEVVHKAPKLSWANKYDRWSSAEYIVGDHTLDYALLEIKGTIPDQFDLKPLNVPIPPPVGIKFKAMGFPQTYTGQVSFPTIGGEVQSYDATIGNGFPTIQLFCTDAAVGLELQGYSGAPVIVGWDHALGIIRRRLVSKDGGSKAAAGMVFATSVPAILEERPLFFRDVERYRFDPSGRNYWPGADPFWHRA